MSNVVSVLILNILFVYTATFSLVHKQNDWEQRHIVDGIVSQMRDSFLSSFVQAQKSAEQAPWELPVSRTVRAAGNAQQRQCCLKSKQEHSDKMKLNFLNCYKEIKSKAANEELKKNGIKTIICLTQCIGKKYDLLDEKGFLVKDKLMTFLKNETDDVFTEKEEILMRCNDFSKKFSEERGDVNFFGMSCNMAAIAFAQCIKGFGQINCPEDRKVKTQRCEVARSRIEEIMEIWKI